MPTDHVWRQSTIYQAFKNESSKQNIFLIETCRTNVFHEIFQIRYPNKMRPSSRLVGHIRHMSSLYSCLTLGVHTFCTIENLHWLQRQTQIQNRNNAMFVNSKWFTGRLAWKLKLIFKHEFERKPMTTLPSDSVEIREGFTKKKLLFFWILSKLPPPPSPKFGQLVQLFWTPKTSI